MNPQATTKTVKMMLATFAIIAILGVSAFAASVVLSNHLNDQTLVTGSPLTLTEGDDLPGNTAIGITYYMTATLSADVDVTGVIVHLDLGKTGILPSDATVQYSINGATYTALSMTGGTGKISGNIATGENMLAGETMTISISIVFNTAGSYTTDLWAEAQA